MQKLGKTRAVDLLVGRRFCPQLRMEGWKFAGEIRVGLYTYTKYSLGKQ